MVVNPRNTVFPILAVLVLTFTTSIYLFSIFACDRQAVIASPEESAGFCIAFIQRDPPSSASIPVLLLSNVTAHIPVVASTIGQDSLTNVTDVPIPNNSSASDIPTPQVEESRPLSPAGLTCSPEWLAVVANHVPDAARARVLTDGICAESQSATAIALQRWGEDGPGGVGVREEKAESLDGTACAIQMGNASHPMADDEFLATKFLAIGRPPSEQLSKGRQHLAEILGFSVFLNRTLVLPRVGSSWINTHGPLPFCAYFDAAVMGTFVRWVTYDFYVKTSIRLRKKPSVQFFCVQTDFDCELRAVERQVWFLALTHGVTPDPSNTRYTCQESDEACKGKPSYVPKLTEEETLTAFGSVDLLVTAKESPFPVLSDLLPFLHTQQALKHLVFAPKLVEKADAIVSELGPGSACNHLRYEKGSISWSQRGDGESLDGLMLRCAQGMVGFLQTRKVELNLTQVYVASDFSIVTHKGYNNQQWSGEYQNAALVATNRIAEHSASLNLVALESFGEEMTSLDYGTQGVLSKLVCQRTKYFFGGPFECGGTHSFEFEIIEARQKLRPTVSPIERWTAMPLVPLV